MLQGEEEEEGRYEGYSAGGAPKFMAAAAAAVHLMLVAACSCRPTTLNPPPAFPRPADHLAASNPGLRPHPDPLVESASLASVPKPKLTFQHRIAEAVSGGKARAAGSWAWGLEGACGMPTPMLQCMPRTAFGAATIARFNATAAMACHPCHPCHRAMPALLPFMQISDAQLESVAYAK